MAYLETTFPYQLELSSLTQDWGSPESVSLFLGRCQVDTPMSVVRMVWGKINEKRSRVGTVLDFGAGDGRFAKFGSYKNYVGFEIDQKRCEGAILPPNAKLLNECAFTAKANKADVCVGNPPYVRNQDLPNGWRQKVAEDLYSKTGIKISGLANAWLYFFLLSIESVSDTGLVALVIPYEWVSRPSALSIREYIKKMGWEISVYRLNDNTFHRVLTTSCITIVDKKRRTGQWEYFEQNVNGEFEKLPSPCRNEMGVLVYGKSTRNNNRTVFAKRGLSPGTQQLLTLTEGERAHLGLKIGRDVVGCVTSLRNLEFGHTEFSNEEFTKLYRATGIKCWLINTSRTPSEALASYLGSVSPERYQTSTCLGRELWWKFNMPEAPSLLMATGFINGGPKIVINETKAMAIGGVCGIYGLEGNAIDKAYNHLKTFDFYNSIVPHSNGLRKIEINQINGILDQFFQPNH